MLATLLSNFWGHKQSTALGWLSGVVYVIGQVSASAGCATDLRQVKVWGPGVLMGLFGSAIGPGKKPSA